MILKYQVIYSVAAFDVTYDFAIERDLHLSSDQNTVVQNQKEVWRSW